MNRIVKPAELHDRTEEWQSLASFAQDPDPGAVLGIVYGRRRQGKTLLLELLAEVTGGIAFTGLQQANAQNLADLAAAYAAFTGLPGASFTNWTDAIAALLSLGDRLDRPVTVVLDEFPYLVEQAPELPSALQRALSPRGAARRSGQARLILCGSAFTVMQGLLAGSAPLRGRAKLELVLQPFDFREAADFWGVRGDPGLAFQLHSLVGGTPAYKDMCIDSPPSLPGFGQWVVDRLLHPASAMFREGNALLNEDPELGDAALYHAVLSAICGGAHRRSEIAARLGRPDSALSHPLDMLERVRLIRKAEDGLRARRPLYQITEPFLRLHHLLIRPHEARLVGRGRSRVWAESAGTVESLVYGPHLEDLARSWCADHASAETLGAFPSNVEPALIACREHKKTHEIDVVVRSETPHAPSRVLAIGEVKASDKWIGLNQLRRLEHIRELLPASVTGQPPKLMLFARHGFTPDLTEEAGSREDVELIDLDRLYRGS